MITFVCWKWRGPDPARAFESHHVNVLEAMIARHYPGEHQLVCITDDPEGLSPTIISMPMPPTGFEHLRNPSEIKRNRFGSLMPSDKIFPSCYRRLWMFSDHAIEYFGAGEKVVLIDIDVVITGDLRPLVDRQADFIGWCDPRFMWNKVAGGVYLLKVGSHTEVWNDFDSEKSPAIAFAAGNGGSDQAWLSYKLYSKLRATWSTGDGLTKLKWLHAAEALPSHIRMVFTSGETPPWSVKVQDQYPWVIKHWRL